MTIAVVAEKPSVARDIAAVLGATRRQAGALVGGGYVVTWAVGHLVGLAEPHEMQPEWRAWRTELLPMIPREWKLRVLPEGKDQYAHVAAVLRDPAVDRVVCATDAGREGELIFRYIQRLARCRKPVDRLWISSLTAGAIRDGFARLRPAAEYDRLGAAAEARGRADWLVGMNLTRFYSIGRGPEVYSVGRVQTPTLAMIVDREREIRAFVPEPYCEVRATFGVSPGDRYQGVWFDPVATGDEASRGRSSRLPPDGARAAEIQQRCSGGQGVVTRAQGTDKRMPPPLLYDLTELQRHANRLYGLTAKATLAAAQALYEQHKLISYPRTDSRHLSSDVAAAIGPVARAVGEAYGDAVAPGTGERPLSRRFVDDAQVTDHHAIVPTGGRGERSSLPRDEERVYDLICRRLLMAWHEDHRTRQTQGVTEVRSADAVDCFRSSGTVVTQMGWKALDVPGRERSEEETLPDGFSVGQRRPVTRVEALRKETQPPKRLNDATLLTAMETAGRCLDDRELEEAMRERGLGTPATRAAVIETLLSRGYIEREGKALRATLKGEALIDAVPEKVKSPVLTGEWEHALALMERGQGTLEAFMGRIEAFVREIVEGTKASGPRPIQTQTVSSAAPPRTPGPATERNSEPERGVRSVERSSSPRVPVAVSRPMSSASASASAGRSQGATSDLQSVLRERFELPSFRPHQEEVCQAVAAGVDALLVMPTGSGKSLCYQLPGIARGGTTLVVSPLIALMDDQVGKLQALGLRAEAIHSGRSREDSRVACRAYLDGTLDFLVIAPERLAVPGFPEMLARRPPTLVAVDEAHCISHWGHDFRPDYRLLGQRLPLLRPAPIVALTATATLRVQDDILVQLGIPAARRFIRGFRRDNLAIEALERPPSQRIAEAVRLLVEPGRRPALVYVPTRKLADEAALALGRRYATAAYHAGLPADERAAAQDRFQRGKVEVVAATVAFGMGVDKADIRTVVHLGLPGSIEAYYQEIGRVGRDGHPARAFLLHGAGDRFIHERFLERDYPEPLVLRAVQKAIPAEGRAREDLRVRGVDAETLAAAVDKLWIHGGVTVDADDRVHRADGDWEPSYRDIRAHRAGQIEDVFGFVRSSGCRMVQLVRHFGDTRDTSPCGHCDRCRPDACEGRQSRPATGPEREHLRRILAALADRDGLSSGNVFKAAFPTAALDRQDFESLVDGLVRAGLVRAVDDRFVTDGRTVRFRRLHLTSDGMGGLPDLAELELEDRAPARSAARPRKRRGAAASAPTERVAPRARATAPGERASRPAAAEAPDGSPARARSNVAAGGRVAEALRTWRLELARRKRIPAFRILTDRALLSIAEAYPTSEAALLAVPGVGPTIVKKYGSEILAVLVSRPT